MKVKEEVLAWLRLDWYMKVSQKQTALQPYWGWPWKTVESENLSSGQAVDSVSSAQSLSLVQHFVTPCTEAHEASLSTTNSWSSLKLTCIKSVMAFNHLSLYNPLLLPPSIFPSIRVFSKESVLHIRWPKCWSFSFSISPSSEYSGLISFRMNELDLLAVQEILKRPETVKLLEENIGKTLSDINHRRILYDPHPRILETKAKINKWDLMKLKSFCTTKETISKVKRQPSD